MHDATGDDDRSCRCSPKFRQQETREKRDQRSSSSCRGGSCSRGKIPFRVSPGYSKKRACSTVPSASCATERGVSKVRDRLLLFACIPRRS